MKIKSSSNLGALEAHAAVANYAKPGPRTVSIRGFGPFATPLGHLGPIGPRRARARGPADGPCELRQRWRARPRARARLRRPFLRPSAGGPYVAAG